MYDSKLGSVLQEQGKFPCVCNELTAELMRGLRMHLTFFIKQLEELDTRKSQLGLAHSFSRGKVRDCLSCLPAAGSCLAQALVAHCTAACRA